MNIQMKNKVKFIFSAVMLHAVSIATLLCLLLFPLSSMADEDPHAHHKAMMKSSNNKSFKRSEHTYNLPDMKFVDQRGDKVSVSEMLESDITIALNFIFTTCNTICPVMSGTFSQLDKKIQEINKPVKLISISIDPEFDTPNVLKEYAEKFNSSESWHFFTGSRDDIIKFQTAFNAYRGSKMNHVPITLLRNAGQKEWVRLDGFATVKSLIEEITSSDNKVSLKKRATY